MSKDAYGRIANWYDKVFDSVNAGLRGISQKMYPPTADMKVLDVGCGTGSHLMAYQQAGCDIYGIDMSPAMLKQAQEKLGDKAKLHLGDASDMPYEDDLFDLITTTLMLHEMPPTVRDAVISEMKRVLKPDGHLLFIDFHPGKLKFPKGWFTKIFITTSEIIAGREHFKNYRQFIRTKGLPTLIASHQLTIEKQKIVSSGNMVLFLLSTQ